MTKNYVWIVAGGTLQVPVVREAQRLGFKTLVTDVDPLAPCAAIADEFYVADTSDVQAHLELAARVGERVRGICGPASDTEVTVAAVAESLGLPTCGVSAALRCKNKALMRNTLSRYYDLNYTQWIEISKCSAKVFRDVSENIGYPVIVKPVDNCASRGVTRVTTPATLAPAIKRAVEASGTGTCLVEHAWDRAAEYTCEIIFDENGDWHPINICDRFFTDNPYYAVEYGIISPSDVGAKDRYNMYGETARAARALGIKWGVFKVDWLCTPKGEFKLLECTARLSGGFDSTHTQPLAYGSCPVGAVILQSCGEPFGSWVHLLDRPQQKHSACFAAFPPRAGFLKNLDAQASLQVSCVREVHVRNRIGDAVMLPTDCAGRIAFIISQASSREAALRAAQQGVEALDVRTEEQFFPRKTA